MEIPVITAPTPHFQFTQRVLVLAVDLEERPTLMAVVLAASRLWSLWLEQTAGLRMLQLPALAPRLQT
jgi:hypothetical protein